MLLNKKKKRTSVAGSPKGLSKGCRSVIEDNQVPVPVSSVHHSLHFNVTVHDADGCRSMTVTVIILGMHLPCINCHDYTAVKEKEEEEEEVDCANRRPIAGCLAEERNICLS